MSRKRPRRRRPRQPQYPTTSACDGYAGFVLQLRMAGFVLPSEQRRAQS